MADTKFKGDQKTSMNSFSSKYEQKLIAFLLPKLPTWLKGHHLTLMSIPISIGLIILGYYARNNYNWIWASSFLIIAQWFTDSLDGQLGKYRDSKIPRWGFYMDHFLDFVFLISVIIGYSFLFFGQNRELFLLLIPILTGFMINAYLLFGATQKFKLTYLKMGPTEFRILCIILNTLIIYFGIHFIEKSLIYVMLLLLAILIFIVYRTQRQIWLNEKVTN